MGTLLNKLVDVSDTYHTCRAAALGKPKGKGQGAEGAP